MPEQTDKYRIGVMLMLFSGVVLLISGVKLRNTALVQKMQEQKRAQGEDAAASKTE